MQGGEGEGEEGEEEGEEEEEDLLATFHPPCSESSSSTSISRSIKGVGSERQHTQLGQGRREEDRNDDRDGCRYEYGHGDEDKIS